MTIKCPRCSSRYKIDAAGLPDEGTYARCHKCENVFFVRKRSREEVARLRKSVKEKLRDSGVRPAVMVETPREPDSTPALESSFIEEEESSVQPAIEPSLKQAIMEVPSDEKTQTGPAAAHEHDIESLLSAYSPKQPEIEHDEIEPVKVEEIPPVESDESEEPTLNLSPDDIAALLAAHSPAKKTKIDEPSERRAETEIEELLSQTSPKMDQTLALTPSKAQTAQAQPESASVSQDDIAALLAAHAPKPSAEPAPAKKQESAFVAQDDIEALLAANAPKPSAEPAPAKKQESAFVAQDDIEALLAANAPKPSAEPAPVKKQESAFVAQDDIEALLAANAPKPSAEPAPAKKQESAFVAQDDIEALLAANAPKPSAEPAPAKKQESAFVAQDDIEALLAANAPKPSAQPAPAKSKSDIRGMEAKSGIDQDSIDALLAANAPDKAKVETAAPSVSRQDDIDALLSANLPASQPAGAQSGLSGQNEIDALLASAMGKPAPKPSAEPAKTGGDILSQSDLDMLLAQPTAPAAQKGMPKEEGGVISQSDIDSILESAGFAEPALSAKGEAAKPEGDSLLSQDTLDALLSQASQGEGAEAFAPAMAGSPDDELEKLLSGEEDSLGEALFQDSSKAVTSTGEPSLDELLASELTPREPAPGREEEDEFAGAIPGAFARGETALPSFEEEIEEEEPRAKKKGFNPAALLAPIMNAFGKISGKLPIPNIKFIGALFHKLPPRLAGVTAGIALVAVAGLAVGGWWYLQGGKTVEPPLVAMKEPVEKPEAKPAPQPAKEETHLAAPATTQTAAQPAQMAQPAPQAPPAPAPVAVSTAQPKGRYPVSFVVYLPVEFDAETNRILNMTVELIFDSEMVAKLARERIFFSAVTVENLIDTFFRDKFYEETVFAQDKLEEFLAQNLKTVQQFAGLKDVRLSNFSID